MTRMQAGLGSRAQVVETGRIFADAFTAAGHDVEFRPTVPGESLREFDAVVVGISKPGSITTDFLFPALDVIGRAIAEGCRLGFFVDDWNVENIPAQMSDYVTNAEKRLFGIKSRKHMDWARENVDQLVWVLTALRDDPWPPTLVPTFPWGDHQKLVEAGAFNPNSRFVFVDPSTGTPPITPTIPNERRRSWVMPSLASIDKHEKWLTARGFTWRPIDVYGPKGYDRLKEPEIVQRYAEARGVISQPYKQVGSGWWRVRFIHAVWARAVLLADPREVAALGDSYHQPPSVIEAMNDSDLDALADAQAKELRDRAWSREQFVDALNDYLVGLPNEVARV